jgi:hypothetical protein
MTPTPRNRLRPVLDQLEAREQPAVLLSSGWTTSEPAAVRAATSPRVESDLGAAVAAYAAGHLGQQVGGGECAHLAVEALRAAGAKFAWLRGPTADYAWGHLVSRVRATPGGAVFSNPAAVFAPGDIIQYHNAVFADGTWATHHTAVVAAVDAAGRVTAVYQQNFDGVRAVTEQALDLTQLTSGWVKVYRPVARAPVAGHYGFTVVNNSAAAVRVVERAGPAAAAYSLSAADTLASYQVRGWVTVGGARPVIRVGTSSITVTDGAAYEIYDGPTGPAVRVL